MTKNMPGVNMEDGLDPAVFRELIYQMVRERSMIQNVHEVVGAIEFEYTYWAKPDNKSAVRQNLIDVGFNFHIRGQAKLLVFPILASFLCLDYFVCYCLVYGFLIIDMIALLA